MSRPQCKCHAFKLPIVPGPTTVTGDYHTLSSSSSESNMPPPASAGGAPKAECTAIVSGSASVLAPSNPSTSRSERLENPKPCVRSTPQPIRQGQHSTLSDRVARKHTLAAVATEAQMILFRQQYSASKYSKVCSSSSQEQQQRRRRYAGRKQLRQQCHCPSVGNLRH